jgi:hypothetical protein
LEWWMSSKLWLFLLVKHMVHPFCPSIMWVMEPKTATEKGNLRPCLRPKLDFTPKKIGKVLLILALTKLIMSYVMRVYEIIKARYFG